MDIVSAEVEEERLVAVLAHEADGMLRDGIGNVLVFPKCLATSFHESDAADAIDDGLIMPMTGAQVEQQFRVRLARGLAFEVAFVAHRYGCRGVVVGHSAILYVDTWHAVGRGSHDVVIVEPQVAQMLVQRLVPVLPCRLTAQAQMPLADGSRSIASLVEKVGQGELLRFDDHAGITSSHVGVRASPGIHAREQRIARWRAGGCRCMSLREAQSGRSQLVDVGCADVACPVARQVAIAQVVGQDDDHVGLVCSRFLVLGSCRRCGHEHRCCDGEASVHAAKLRIIECRTKETRCFSSIFFPFSSFSSQIMPNFVGCNQ